MTWAVFTRTNQQLSTEFDTEEEAAQAILEARPMLLAALDQAGAHVEEVQP
jgi:hypothetical protein